MKIEGDPLDFDDPLNELDATAVDSSAKVVERNGGGGWEDEDGRAYLMFLLRRKQCAVL